MLFQSLANFACMKDQTWSNSITLPSFFSCFENYHTVISEVEQDRTILIPKSKVGWDDTSI